MTRDAEARQILQDNDRGGYTIPTAGLYPYQWNWDSAFAAWGFSTFDLPRAWTEIETLFTGQWPNGMVPHILFHKPDPGYFPGPDVWGCEGPVSSSGISQPPVAASVVARLYVRDPALGRPHAERLLPKLAAWHRWFMEWRTDRGAATIAHPWEAGRDNAPDWDGAMAAIDPGDVGPYTRRDTSHVDASMRPTKADYDRYLFLVQRGRRLRWDEAAMAEGAPFRVADPGQTFILMRANRDLARLAQALGQDTAEIDAWTAQLETGAETLWNPDLAAYDSRDALTGRFSGTLSCASFLCWYGGLDDPRMNAPLARILADVPWPVPSLDPRDPRFDAKRYWRGPTWGVLNTLIGTGLTAMGRPEGEILRLKTAALIDAHGMAEYFDPMTGAPAGGGHFTWTAAIWLAWASPNAEAT